MILSVNQLTVFLLICARLSGIFIMAPFFNSRSIPSLGKAALIIWISTVLWFVVPVAPQNIPLTPTHFLLALLAEVTVGFLLGFICNIIFMAVQSAGELMDMQMGLSVAQTFDPTFGAQVTIVGRFVFYAALTTFLIVNGHHFLLSVFHQSFRMLPLGGLPNFATPKLTLQLIELGKVFFTIALQLAGPIILLIFLSDFAFGIVSRVAPQVNVFMLGFQVKPALGIIGILFTLPLLVKHIANLLEKMGEEMLKLLVFLR
jgi:flagellar biosynthetic protein FliR